MTGQKTQQTPRDTGTCNSNLLALEEAENLENLNKLLQQHVDRVFGEAVIWTLNVSHPVSLKGAIIHL